MRTRRPLEHAAALSALVLAFIAVTAGIGTVAATASSDTHPTPHVLPSAAFVPSARSRQAPTRLAKTSAPGGIRPGVAAHVSPGAPLRFHFRPGAEPLLPLNGMAAGIVVDIDSKQVLWYENPWERRPTASLAKVFTVMVAMDHARSFDEPVVVPPGGEDDNPSDSVMGLHVGDTVTVGQLVDGIWLASGDDAAETLARAWVPRDEFVAEMNAKAAWLGLQDTHFTNPSGLDDPGEYSTPYDLAVASGWLWTHYQAAFSLAWQPYIPLTVRGRDLSLRTLNKLVTQMPGDTKPYPGANGLKTGDTPNAGGCVIATAQRGSKRLVAVVMGDDFFFTDAGKLLDYGFATDG